MTRGTPLYSHETYSEEDGENVLLTDTMYHEAHSGSVHQTPMVILSANLVKGSMFKPHTV